MTTADVLVQKDSIVSCDSRKTAWYVVKMVNGLRVKTLSILSSGWPKSRRKNSLSFPGFSTATNLLSHRLSQQKVNVIMTFIKGLMILFTQSTAV